MRVVLEGAFEKRLCLDLIRYFVAFEDMGGGVLLKKMAGGVSPVPRLLQPRNDREQRNSDQRDIEIASEASSVHF